MSIWDRDYLFGDWHGLRPMLAEGGIEFELVYTGEYFENFDGGIAEGGDYRGDLSLTIGLDTEAAGWWDNGEFFVHLQHQHGDSITEDYVGDFQVLSNIDADDYTQISEVWYQHLIADETLRLKFGKMEANEDFAFVEYGGEFINSSPGFSPTIPLVTYPDQDWGAVIGWQPIERFSITAGVYQGRPDGGRSVGNTIDSLYGPMVMVEPAVHYALNGKPGHFRLGYWYNGDDFDELDGTGTDDGTDGVYLTWDQLVYRDTAEGEDVQGIGVFAQLGFSDGDVIEAEEYYGAGAQWTGAIPSRDNDVLGLGIFHVELSADGGFAEDSETAIELFYKAQVTPWFSVKGDVQYITNPGGTTNSDALVTGVRFEVSF